MENITFNHFVQNPETESLELKEITIAYADIKEFGVRQRKAYRSDRSFKKFFAAPYIIANDNKGYYKILTASVFKDLKEVFKDKCEVSKETVEEHKKTRYGYAERKAVEWTFKVYR